MKKTWVAGEESRVMQLCGFGERRALKGSSLDSHGSLATTVSCPSRPRWRVRSATPTSFLSLRRWSALPAVSRHANIDYRPSRISSQPSSPVSLSSNHFPTPTAGLFFLPYYFRQCFTMMQWWRRFRGWKATVKIAFQKCNYDCQFYAKNIMFIRRTVFSCVYVP